jgi:hypothetical protein
MPPCRGECYSANFAASTACDIDRVSVQATAVQLSDGRIDDGSVHEPPHVYLDDDALSSAQARALAAALIDAADEADRWAIR